LHCCLTAINISTTHSHASKKHLPQCRASKDGLLFLQPAFLLSLPQRDYSILRALVQTLLPDGVRTVITGGTVSMNVSTPVPSAEIYNHASFNIVKQDTLAILQRFRGMILYPLGEL
jgi:hypothetical protein